MTNRERILSALILSIALFGQLQPIIVDEHGNVLDGRLRMEACRALGIKPWIEMRPGLTKAVRPHTYIRTAPDPLEFAEFAADVRQEVAPDGAQRAPGAGRIQAAVAKEMADRYGLEMSPRSVAYALQLSRMDAGAKAAIETIEPTSMKEALRAAEAHQLGEDNGASQGQPDRVQLLKRAHEFKAICARIPAEALTDADIAYCDDLIEMLQRMKRESRTDAPA